jgi:hypothetical protein
MSPTRSQQQANEWTEEALSLFGHDGWKRLVADLAEVADALRHGAIACRTAEEIAELRGDVRRCEQIIAYEDMVRHELDAQTEDAELEDAEL